MSTKNVLSVGQCVPDHGGISRLLKSFDVDLAAADTIADALQLLRQQPRALVLVNRIFDATAENGLDLIRQIKADPGLAATPVMLVSNHADAQREAVALGAAAGFGKAALHAPATRECLQPFLG